MCHKRKNITIAPGESKQAVSILLDEKCAELAYIPFLFPTGKFGYRVERDIQA